MLQRDALAGICFVPNFEFHFQLPSSGAKARFLLAAGWHG
jgi:hypothetical protein